MAKFHRNRNYHKRQVSVQIFNQEDTKLPITRGASNVLRIQLKSNIVFNEFLNKSLSE